MALGKHAAGDKARAIADDRAAGEVLTTIGAVPIPSWIAAAGIPGGFALVMTHLLFKAADSVFEMRLTPGRTDSGTTAA